MLFRFLQCDPGHATDVLYNSLYFRNPMIAVLGAACQSVTRATAQSGRNWNLLQVNIIQVDRMTYTIEHFMKRLNAQVAFTC